MCGKTHDSGKIIAKPKGKRRSADIAFSGPGERGIQGVQPCMALDVHGPIYIAKDYAFMNA